jgi:hypothetical protein
VRNYNPVHGNKTLALEEIPGVSIFTIGLILMALMLGERERFRSQPPPPLPLLRLASSFQDAAYEFGNLQIARDTPGARSIRDWVACDGVKDDALGAAAAFAAAKNGAFTLLVDCPVFIHIGMDILRPIFVESGTTVQFAKEGLFITDNVLVPAFVLANSTSIRFLDWRVKYVGRMPVDPQTGGYYKNGAFVASGAHAPPASAFHDLVLTPWLSANRGVRFDQSNGHVTAPWPGPTNTSAIFYLSGGTTDVHFRGLKLFVEPSAGGHEFIPICFSSYLGFNNNQTVTAKTPITSNFLSVPHNINFSDIELDGYYFGWQGKFQNSRFEHVRAHRYGDLQDSSGANVGGVGKWFAPPHLFYLNYEPKQAGLENRNIYISDVIDYGERVGVARDRGGADTRSGYANSLKIGGIDSSVDNYKSYRPDGLVDVLTSDNLRISNIDATYDSSFLNNVYPAIRFPADGYKRVTLENVTIVDKAVDPKMVPILGSNDESSTQITFKNVNVTLNNWSQTRELACHFAGSNHHIEINYKVLARSAPQNGKDR